MARDKGSTRSNVQPPPQPATEGNVRALTHGAHSPRLVMPAAEELAAQALRDVPYLSEADGPAIKAWAVSEVTSWRLANWLERVGLFDSKNRVRPAVAHLRQWLETASRHRARLGLDPVSRQSLRLDVARTEETLAALYESGLAEGRAALEAAESRSDAPSTADG